MGSYRLVPALQLTTTSEGSQRGFLHLTVQLYDSCTDATTEHTISSMKKEELPPACSGFVICEAWRWQTRR